jgi:hypothetical protein
MFIVNKRRTHTKEGNMIYQNKKNLTMAKLGERNEGANKVKLVMSDGSEIEVTISTFKRWWKKVDDEDDEDVAGDETNCTEVILEDKSTEVVFNSADEVLANLVNSGKKVYVNDATEAVKKAGFQVDVEYIQKYLENSGNVQHDKHDNGKKKEKKVRVKKEKKEKAPKRPVNDQVPAIQEFINNLVQEMGGEVFQPPKAKSVNLLKVGGHMFARINYSKYGALVCCRKDIVKDIAVPDKDINHIFNAGYNFLDLQEKKDLVKQLIETSFKAQQEKNTVKEDKLLKKQSKKQAETAKKDAGVEKEVA